MTIPPALVQLCDITTTTLHSCWNTTTTTVMWIQWTTLQRYTNQMTADTAESCDYSDQHHRLLCLLGWTSQDFTTLSTTNVTWLPKSHIHHHRVPWMIPLIIHSDAMSPVRSRNNGAQCCGGRCHCYYGCVDAITTMAGVREYHYHCLSDMWRP